MLYVLKEKVFFKSIWVVQGQGFLVSLLIFLFRLNKRCSEQNWMWKSLCHTSKLCGQFKCKTVLYSLESVFWSLQSFQLDNWNASITIFMSCNKLETCTNQLGSFLRALLCIVQCFLCWSWEVNLNQMRDFKNHSFHEYIVTEGHTSWGGLVLKLFR